MAAAAQTPVRLRPPGPDDEVAFLRAHREMAEHDRFPFGLGYEPGMPWADYLDHLERCRTGIDLPPGLVPADLLLAVVGDELVGRVSIRFELNEYLARQGGHIGYGVLPAHRRRGYATTLLWAALAVLAERGLPRALVTCDDINVGSAAVIESCGGRLDGVVLDADTAEPIRRYWIALG